MKKEIINICPIHSQDTRKCDECLPSSPAVSFQERVEEAHKTEDGYCCACEADIALLQKFEHCDEIECPECQTALLKRVLNEILDELQDLEFTDCEPVIDYHYKRKDVLDIVKGKINEL